MHKPRLKIIALDMDGTLTSIRSSWEYLHRRMGIWNNQADKYQDQFRAGEISYEEFCRLDALMWQDINLNKIINILNEIPLYKDAEKLLQVCLDLGSKPVLLSTGLKLLADRLAGQLNINYYKANELLHRDGYMTGECVVHVTTHGTEKTKEAYLKKIMHQLNATPAETVAVGDSIGDMEMFFEAGMAIAVNPHPGDLAVLQENVPNLITVADLGEVISIIRKYY